jgi:hypothetical protein
VVVLFSAEKKLEFEEKVLYGIKNIKLNLCTGYIRSACKVIINICICMCIHI